MQFLVIAYDGTDEQAPERRLAVREQHMTQVAKMKAVGTVLYGAAILNDNEQMMGSIMVLNFETREALDQWLETEPYVVGNVWENITIQHIRTAPTFTYLLEPASVSGR
jgi:uncharacterized protein